MTIPFHKLHGAKNDFLLTWLEDAPSKGLPEIAVAICDRYTGVGADGWMLVDRDVGQRFRRVHTAVQFRWQRTGAVRQRDALCGGAAGEKKSWPERIPNPYGGRNQRPSTALP